MQKEYVLSINDIKEPRVLEGKEAIATLLVRLILLEPGTIPDKPMMGVGLKNYRYSQREGVEDLRKRIHGQITTYLPRYQGADVTVKLNKNNTLTIGIEIDGVLYKYETEEQGVNNSDIALANLNNEY